jgi:hypothetical protein
MGSKAGRSHVVRFYGMQKNSWSPTGTNILNMSSWTLHVLLKRGPFLGSKRGRGVMLTTHSHLVPRSSGGITLLCKYLSHYDLLLFVKRIWYGEHLTKYRKSFLVNSAWIILQYWVCVRSTLKSRPIKYLDVRL